MRISRLLPIAFLAAATACAPERVLDTVFEGIPNGINRGIFQATSCLRGGWCPAASPAAPAFSNPPPTFSANGSSRIGNRQDFPQEPVRVQMGSFLPTGPTPNPRQPTLEEIVASGALNPSAAGSRLWDAAPMTSGSHRGTVVQQGHGSVIIGGQSVTGGMRFGR